MTARTFFRIVAVLTSILAAGSETHAGVMLNAEQMINGSNVTVQFYLNETGGGTSLTDVGLFAFDFRVNYNPAELAFQSVLVDPSFDLLSGYEELVVGQLDLFGAAEFGAFDNSSVPGVFVPLASVTFQSLVGGTSTITLGPSHFPPDFPDYVHFAFNDAPDFTSADESVFDPNANNTFVLDIPPTTVVPEPGSVAVFTILGLCVLRRQFSRVVFRAGLCNQ